MKWILNAIKGLFNVFKKSHASSTSESNLIRSAKPEDALNESIKGTHFTWGEALRQGNTGIVAQPTPEQYANIVMQAHLLEKVRDLIGPMRVTSWLRTPEHNKRVGGAKNSAHLQGAATDFVPTQMDVETAKTLIRHSGIYPGGGEINSRGWVHLDFIHKKWFIA